MQPSFIVVLLFLAMASTANGGVITIDLGGPPITWTPTAAHDAAVQRLVDEVNVQIQAQNAANASFNAANPRLPQRTISPLMTAGQYVKDAFVKTMDTWARVMRLENAKTACDTYRTLPRATQDAIKTTLGGREPCE